MIPGTWKLLNSAFKEFDEMVLLAKDVLLGNTFDTMGVWNNILGLSEVLKPFCYIVIALCVLIELVQMSTRIDAVRWEHGLKAGIKMVLARVCIDVAPTFLLASYRQANLWIESAAGFASYVSLSSRLSDTVQAELANISGILDSLALFVVLAIVGLAIRICGLMVVAIAFGRMFELFVYLAVSPLPCAFMPLGDGGNSTFSRITQKFFKSFIAICLQGLMMVICIGIFNMIIGSTFDTLLASNVTAGDSYATVMDLCFTMLMGTIVLIMSIARCGSWAKNIIDAM